MPIESYVHSTRPGEPGAPLLFLFHGTGGDEHQLDALGDELLPTAAVIAPRGDVSEMGAARFFRRTGEGVYDMDDLARATTKMAAFVRAHKDQNPGRKVFGLGYSNGGNILASVVFAVPDLFDAAVLMHPLIPFEPEIAGSLAGKPILITAGRRDPICPPELTARLDAYLRAAAADVRLEWHEGGHEIRPGEIAAARQLLDDAQKGTTRMTEEPSGVERQDSDSKGRYVFRGSDGAEAEMTFSKVGEHRIIIDHTEVPDVFRGQGIGLKLVTRAVEDARASGKKIIPLCPFANAQFKRHPEWADVLNQ